MRLRLACDRAACSDALVARIPELHHTHLRERASNMAQDDDDTRGVSAPLSTDTPTERDLKLTNELVQELKAQNNFESPEQTQKRYTYTCVWLLSQNRS